MPKPKQYLISRMTLCLLGMVLALAACSPAATESTTPPTVPAVNTDPTQPASTEAPTALPEQTEVNETSAGSTTQGQLRLVIAQDGNEARYRVREQLANLSAPSDAVGATSVITGTLVLNPDGTLVSHDSKFVVDLTTLKSDSNMRDGFIQRSTLETSKYPTAEFVPQKIIGLPSPLPTSGDVTFQLAGDMTVHGVTRPTTWAVTAQIEDQGLTGSAATEFKFADFGMTIPSVMRVLSIQDNIKLELDFHLVLDTAANN